MFLILHRFGRNGRFINIVYILIYYAGSLKRNKNLTIVSIEINVATHLGLADNKLPKPQAIPVGKKGAS